MRHRRRSVDAAQAQLFPPPDPDPQKVAEIKERKRAESKRSYWRRREKLLPQMREAHKRRKEEGKTKAYREANAERYREHNRRSREKYKDKYNAQRRERRKVDPTVAEKHRLSLAKWKEAHRDEWRKRKREEQSKRRSRIRGEKVDYDEVYGRDAGICYLCGRPVAKDEAQFDHVVPLIRGGLHVLGNIYTTHARCNQRKNRFLVEELDWAVPSARGVAIAAAECGSA